VILPSSFTGVPRYMQQRKQDAMVYVAKNGRLDIFITMTCNSNWSEIKSCLSQHSKPQYRNNIITRVFHLKIKKLVDLIVKDYIFKILNLVLNQI